MQIGLTEERKKSKKGGKEMSWKLFSGEEVASRPNAHHKADVVSLLPEVFGKIDSQNRQFIEVEVDLGRIVGETICVETGSGDEIIYARRPKRDGLTRFVKNRQPKSCSSVVVVLKKVAANQYVLITAFVGIKPEPEPWNERYFRERPDPAFARETAKEFWSSHALIWGAGEKTIPGTETTKCPW